MANDDKHEAPPPHIYRADPVIRELIEDVWAAGSQIEWDHNVAQLVHYLACIASGGNYAQADMGFALFVKTRLEMGFHPPPHRAPMHLRARHDAYLVRHCASKNMTQAEAVAFMQEQHRIPRDAARRRVNAAARLAGVALPHGPPGYAQPSVRARRKKVSLKIQ